MSEEDLDFERFQTMAVFSIREELESLIAGREPRNLKRLVNAIMVNYGRLDHKIAFTQNLRSTTDYVYKHVINTAILCALISSLNDTPFLEGRSTIISSSNKSLYIQYVVTRFSFFVYIHNYNII